MSQRTAPQAQPNAVTADDILTLIRALPQAELVRLLETLPAHSKELCPTKAVVQEKLLNAAKSVVIEQLDTIENLNQQLAEEQTRRRSGRRPDPKTEIIARGAYMLRKQGRTYKEIAARVKAKLGISLSPRTIKSYVDCHKRKQKRRDEEWAVLDEAFERAAGLGGAEPFEADARSLRLRQVDQLIEHQMANADPSSAADLPAGVGDYSPTP